MDLESTAVELGPFRLTTKQLLAALKRSRRLQPLLVDAFTESYLVHRATNAGIKVSDEELQSHADNFRRQNGLLSPEQVQNWFKANGITQNDFALGLSRDLMISKFRDQLATPFIDKTFEDNKHHFELVTLRRLVVADQNHATELKDQILSNMTTFADAATQHSIDQQTKAAGGQMAPVRRRELLPALQEPIFAAEIGSTVGPFAAGNAWVLFEVQERTPAILDDTLRTQLKKEIFDRWLQQEYSKAKFDFPILAEGALD
ncbi:MAG: peptidylprolyl isomerase [Zavarzinella sp.]